MNLHIDSATKNFLLSQEKSLYLGFRQKFKILYLNWIGSKDIDLAWL